MKALLRGRPWLAPWLLYASLLAFLLVHHEPWRDEMQAWLLARDSGSLSQLWANTRYEGHPLLWHVLLWVVSRFTTNPLAMQVTHWFVACLAVGVFLRWAPFPLILRGFWVFSYFPFYEYGAISRNYSLTMLGLFLTLSFWSRPCLPFLAAALTAHTSPIGALLSPLLLLALLLRQSPSARSKKTRMSLAFLLALNGWGLAVLSLLPPPDYAHARGVFLGWDPLRAYYVLRGVTTAFVPAFRPQLHFWNESWLFPFPPPALHPALLLAGFVFAFCVLGATRALIRAHGALTFFGTGLVVLLVFFYVKFPGAARHHGFVLLWFVACLWMARLSSAESEQKRVSPFLVVATLGGLVGTAVASWTDLRNPFSAGKLVAPLVREGCRHRPVLGHPDWAASTVAGFLPPGRMVYLTTGRPGSFVVWDLERKGREALADEQLVQAATAWKGCLLLNRPLETVGMCTAIGTTPPGIVADERFWLYSCNR